MDAYNPYLQPRPPPPPPPSSTADPQYHYQYPPPRPPAPPPPQPSWSHSNQFQYQTSPSPPPPPQWAPPPPAYHQPSPHPYPPTYLNHQFPPPPPPPPPTQYPNSYPQQEWSNPNWGYQQSWNHPDSNAEDWAARAKAWADAKAAIDNQHPQSQYSAPTGRLEEQNHYQNQYPQTVDSHYPESHEQLHAGPGYQEYALSSAPTNGQPSTISGSGSSSYPPDGHLPYSGRDGALTADQKTTFPQQESLPSYQSIHQQEVPSSYSSVSGQSMVSHLPVSAAQEGAHPPIPAAAGSVPAEQTFAYGSHLPEPVADLANQPLQFTPRYSRDQDSLPAGYARNIDPVGNTASVTTWPSSMVPDVAYPSMPPSLTQNDPSMSVPSHLPGHSTASFPRFPVPNFQSTIPSPSASFGIGAGVGLPPGATFAGDGYGVSNISERPKKAPVPNWLREEIIKTKASIASSTLGHAKDEEQSLEDEGVDKFQKSDPADRKSHEPSRSTEDNEDDDEDYVEAARTAAINQEIKRLLTEVLLKVTDELFDEIATKVLDEDNMASDDEHDVASAGNKVVPSMGAATISKAPVRFHLPAAAKELDTGHSEKSSSSSEGNVLGLVNYASDDEKDVGDEEVTTSNLASSTRGSTPMSSGDGRFLNPRDDAQQNGKFEERNKNQANLETGSDRVPSIQNGSAGGGDSIYNEIDELEPAQPSNGAGDDGMKSNGAVLDGAHASVSAGLRKPTSPDAEGRESKVKSSGTGKDESRRFSSGQASSKEPERAKTMGDEKLDDKIRRKEEKHQRKEKTERHESKDKKEQGKSGERVKESQSRKRSSDHEIREDRKESERSHKASSKGDYSRGSERKDREESRSGRENDSSRHRRRRSSTDSRDRTGKDDKNSSDEASNDSRRKSRSRKRNLSPSPVRSRRRQVSRSPHSKRSQRKHSPYSSLESTRGRRRSRSRSPVRRQR